ncbi:hypothetical protein TBR22_A17690 [Luteitalea sp. TBR-22]|nr:hypothetical protein TBR22_A17690 [Luteitalea sp. TBR-22]
MRQEGLAIGDLRHDVEHFPEQRAQHRRHRGMVLGEHDAAAGHGGVRRPPLDDRRSGAVMLGAAAATHIR